MSARPRSRKRPILAVSSAANVSTRPSQKRRRTSASVVDKENACSIRKKDSASKSCHGNQVVPDDDGARFAPDADFENLWDEDCSSSTVEKQVQLCDPKGYFVLLPTEVLHALLTLLDHRELAALGRTSSELLYAVEGFVFTHAGVRHVLPPLTGSPSHFAALGKLVKLLTALQHVRSRLKAASFFLTKLQPACSALREQCSTECMYTCFGQLFHSFVSGWEGHSKALAYCLVNKTARLEVRVGQVLQAAPGRLAWHEKDVRLLLQLLFLRPTAASSREEHGYWLDQLLKPWPITFQAKLLYLLTGPVDSQGLVCWDEMCMVPASGSQLSVRRPRVGRCAELASALVVLHQHCRSWSLDDIISIYDELTTTPHGWSYENVARLLLGCGDAITKGLLSSRARNGRTDELSVLMFHLLRVCGRADIVQRENGKNVRWFVSLLRYVSLLISPYSNRQLFISTVLEHWREHIRTLVDTVEGVTVAEEDDMVSVVRELHSSVAGLIHLSASLLTMAVDSAW